MRLCHQRPKPIAVAVRSRREEGASLVEYALLVALIAVVCIVAVTFLGGSASGSFDKGANALGGKAGGGGNAAAGAFAQACAEGGGDWSPSGSGSSYTLTCTGGTKDGASGSFDLSQP
ncbi:Flp family type IVb pilin [Aquihabitans daechungensis]|uniref:Flp family type IVb pilin n=1 Tax=Aquihabitans daechungensis TaxID=1052257 RepID=UPI003B9E86B9